MRAVRKRVMILEVLQLVWQRGGCSQPSLLDDGETFVVEPTGGVAPETHPVFFREDSVQDDRVLVWDSADTGSWPSQMDAQGLIQSGEGPLVQYAMGRISIPEIEALIDGEGADLLVPVGESMH